MTGVRSVKAPEQTELPIRKGSATRLVADRGAPRRVHGRLCTPSPPGPPMVAADTGLPAQSRLRPHGGPASSRRYERRLPEKTPLHRVVSENLESWRERAARPVPSYVEGNFTTLSSAASSAPASAARSARAAARGSSWRFPAMAAGSALAAMAGIWHRPQPPSAPDARDTRNRHAAGLGESLHRRSKNATSGVGRHACREPFSGTGDGSSFSLLNGGAGSPAWLKRLKKPKSLQP
jgi:hypothetical protein